MARRPDGTLPTKLSRRSELIGAYRMFNNAKVNRPTIIQAHRTRCWQWLAAHPGRALLLHDTTVLDYSGLDIEELGQVGDGHGRGYYAHNSLLVIPATRQVVGLVQQILHRRATVSKNETKKQRATREDRESRLWKKGVSDLPAVPAGVEVIDVSDRGSDISEYIAHEIQAQRKFVVRSQHNRVTVDDEGERAVAKLHDRLGALAPMGQYQLARVPKADGGWREATMALSWERVRLLPPRQARGDHGPQPLEVWAVITREVDAPLGEKALEWILLSNCPVDSLESAKQTVEDYACRWVVEEYHKAMKTGCGIEQLQMTTAHGLGNAIAVLSILAVHVLKLRCHSRDETIREQPACLHEEELKVQLAAREVRHPDWRSMTVWEFYLAVAKLGGYQLNPKKRPPGWQILWRGCIRLEDMCAGARLWSERCV